MYIRNFNASKFPLALWSWVLLVGINVCHLITLTIFLLNFWEDCLVNFESFNDWDDAIVDYCYLT
eukprot:UN18572